ncbi:hypothetical protein [Streptomyces poriticola]|uniref:hypothetical protein n=1 Tax=Streptomyces poriticola TaxID=3120506 RepID=UPI002FCE3D77
MTRSVQAVAYGRSSVLVTGTGGQLLGPETSGSATPGGAVAHPRFFSGFLTSPRAASEELLPPAPEPVREAPAAASPDGLAGEVGALLAAGGGMSACERALDGLVRHPSCGTPSRPRSGGWDGR